MFDEVLSFDFLANNEIEVQQLKLVQSTIAHAKACSKFYATKLAQFENILSLTDLQKIPCTSKDELNGQNKEFIAVSKNKVLRTVTTSGTLGSPTQVPLSENDLNRLAHNEYLALKIAGITAANNVQLVTSLDPAFMATLAYELGLKKISAGVIKTGTEKLDFQWKSLQNNQIDVIIIVPSFFLKLLHFAHEQGFNIASLNLKKAICIGEPIRNQDYSLNALGQKIQSLFPTIALHSTYASTEMATAFTECERRIGGHQLRELIYTEILDEHEQPVKNDEYGELTITTLQNEAFPLIRFKTGDIVRLETSPCYCGRTSPRISPVLGRKAQQMKLKGTTVYPQAVFDSCAALPEINEYQLVVVKNALGLDELTIYLSLSQSAELDFIEAHFKSKLKVTPRIEIISTEDMKQKQWKHGVRKPIKFIDLRNQ